jgi:tetratricopeptide (TPR) repeat protein
VSEGRLRERILELTLVVVSIAFCFLCIEAGYRAYLFYTYAIKADYAVDIIDAGLLWTDIDAPGNVFGPQEINAVYNKIYYNGQNEIIYRHKVHVNNLGWISQYNYSVAKASGEYRIAILGGSTTAAETSELGWTDVMQDQLNADSELLTTLGVKKISVINIGVGAADMPFIAVPETLIASRFSPDMTLINFSIENVLAGGDAKEFKPPPKLNELLEAPILEIPRLLPVLRELVSGVEIPLTCSHGAQTTTNPDCRVLPLWYVPPGTTLSSADLAEIKQTVARRRLLYTVLLSPRPLALLRALGHAAIPQARAATLTDLQQRGFATALSALRFIRQLQPHLLLTHNPHLWHEQPSTSILIDDLLAQIRADGFDIVRMADYMPAHTGSQEAISWYMFNGHWNDHGAEVYGKAIYRVVRQRLLAERDPTQAREKSACVNSFVLFEQGRATLAKSDLTHAAADLDAAIAALPADNMARAKRNGAAYADCGFVSDLHVERATLFQESGESAAAAEQWQAAFASAENPTSLYERRAALRFAKGDEKGAIEDFTELIRLAPDIAGYYISRGDLRLKAKDGAGALADFEAVLRAGQSDAAIRFRMSQARWILEDYAGVVDDTTAGLAQVPRNAGLLFMRSIAHERLHQLEAALADISAAAAADPDNGNLRATRENLLKQMAGENTAK